MRSAELNHQHLEKLHYSKKDGMDSFFPVEEYKDCVLDLINNSYEMKWCICEDIRAITKFSWKGSHVIVLTIPFY